MEKILDTLGIFDFGDEYGLIVPDEIIEDIGWLESDDPDTLTYSVLDNNTLILEKNKVDPLLEMTVILYVSDGGYLFDPKTFSLYTVEIPKCVMSHSMCFEWKWESEDDPIEWILVDKNLLMLKRLG